MMMESATMEFCWTTFEVKDIQRSIDFYHGLLGLKIDRQWSGSSGAQLAMLGEKGGPMLELFQRNDPGDLTGAGKGVTIGLKLDNIDELLDELKDMPEVNLKGPTSPNESTTFYFINDPDGYAVQLIK